MMMVRKMEAASSHMVMPNTIFWKRPTASTLLIISAALPKNVYFPARGGRGSEGSVGMGEGGMVERSVPQHKLLHWAQTRANTHTHTIHTRANTHTHTQHTKTGLTSGAHDGLDLSTLDSRALLDLAVWVDGNGQGLARERCLVHLYGLSLEQNGVRGHDVTKLKLNQVTRH